MADLLVKLYELPAAEPVGAAGVTVRRAMAYEKHVVVGWVRARFGEAWASECEVAFANQPISCQVATQQGEILGFACYDATARGLFGPIGVAENMRRRGIGRALLLHTLRAMSAMGYAYAIVGGAGDADFYARTVGATEIPGSTPGLYRDRLKVPPA
jgi:GNAT superfamily N-acetyltransferase